MLHLTGDHRAGSLGVRSARRTQAGFDAALSNEVGLSHKEDHPAFHYLRAYPTAPRAQTIRHPLVINEAERGRPIAVTQDNVGNHQSAESRMLGKMNRDWRYSICFSRHVPASLLVYQSPRTAMAHQVSRDRSHALRAKRMVGTLMQPSDEQ